VKFPLKNICKSQMYFEHSIINQLNLKGFILFFILFLFFFSFSIQSIKNFILMSINSITKIIGECLG
jgi:hypothetical protein